MISRGRCWGLWVQELTSGPSMSTLGKQSTSEPRLCLSCFVFNEESGRGCSTSFLCAYSGAVSHDRKVQGRKWLNWLAMKQRNRTGLGDKIHFQQHILHTTDRIMVVAWIPEDEAKLPSGREVPGAFILETNPSQGAVLGNLQRVGVGQVLRCGTACLVSLMQCFCLKFIKRFQHSLKYQVNRESSLRKCRILCPSVGVGFQRECQAQVTLP